MARSTSTATMPTPPAPITEPMNVPSRCDTSDCELTSAMP
jgi:hypothetical protein